MTNAITLQQNMNANPSVAQLTATIISALDAAGLQHDGGAGYVSRGGSVYISAGRADQQGFWNDDIKIRISNHGGNLSAGPREFHLTTLQAPEELAANVQRAITGMSRVAAGLHPTLDRRN